LHFNFLEQLFKNAGSYQLSTLSARHEQPKKASRYGGSAWPHTGRWTHRWNGVLSANQRKPEDNYYYYNDDGVHFIIIIIIIDSGRELHSGVNLWTALHVSIHPITTEVAVILIVPIAILIVPIAILIVPIAIRSGLRWNGHVSYTLD